MKLKYIGDDFTYHNLIPQIDIELKHGQEYDADITSDAQTIVINNQVVQSAPSEVRVVFSNGAWIPIMPQNLDKLWQRVS